MADNNVTTAKRSTDALDAVDKLYLNLSFTKSQLTAIISLLEGITDPYAVNAGTVAHAALHFLEYANEGAGELWEFTKSAEEAVR